MEGTIVDNMMGLSGGLSFLCVCLYLIVAGKMRAR
jgi:hypothetical protein